jgi:CheY-like chemotaxis protein
VSVRGSAVRGSHVWAGASWQVLIDINMPVMNGFETLSSIKSNAKLKHIPVILMSSDDGRGEDSAWRPF